MVVVSYSGKEINAKLVYYGPGLSGKTTNLEYIYQSVPQNARGKMVSMKTRTERTLFFDFLPVDLGQLGGFKTRFLLYTVPGQVYYNATRKLVLRGVDALVFVADSQRGKMKENIESLMNLRDNLKDYDLNLDDMPWVIQYNKRDMDDVYTIEELEEELNPTKVPHFEGVATTGDGVFETFRGIGKVVLQKLSKEVKLEERGSRPKARPAANPPAPAAAPAPAAQAKPAAPAPAPAPAPQSADAGGLSLESGNQPAQPAPAAKPAPDLKAVGSGEGKPADKPAADKPKLPQDLPKRTYTPSSEPAGAAAFSEEPEWMNAAGKSSAKAKPAPKLEPAPKAEEPAETQETVPMGSGGLDVTDSNFEPVVKDTDPEPGDRQERNSGFWGRIFGRKAKDESAEPQTMEAGGTEAAPEASPKVVPAPASGLARVEIPAAGISTEGPVFIEKRIQVPVTLSPEDITRGATLRLVLEVKVEAGESSESKAA